MSRASRLTRLRCGANPTRRCASRLPRCAPPPRNMAGRRRASASRCGRSSPTPRRRPGPGRRRSSSAQPRCKTRPVIASQRTAMPPPAQSGCPRLGIWGGGDKRLWTGIAQLTGANSNTTALVGTPEQIAEVFGDYYDLGISHFLIRGFDPLIDAIEYGRELIPLTRKLIAERQAAKGLAAE